MFRKIILVLMAALLCAGLYACKGETEPTTPAVDQAAIEKAAKIAEEAAIDIEHFGTMTVDQVKDYAEQGNAAAMYYLGKIYEEGKVVGQDLVQAKDYMAAAAEKGYEPAVEWMKAHK